MSGASQNFPSGIKKATGSFIKKRPIAFLSLLNQTRHTDFGLNISVIIDVFKSKTEEL